MAGIIDWSQLRQNTLLATQRIDLYNPSYWDKEATAINEDMSQWAELTKKQLKRLPLSSEVTVLDVGAGTGRMTLPMAKRAKHVTALEPSENMLITLRDNARKQHTFNIHYFSKTLEDLDSVASYDWVVASFSLFMLDIKTALIKMNDLASKGVYLFLSASPWLDEGIQKAVQSNSRTWSDFIFIYNILYDAGIPANVDICDYDLKQSYVDLEDAVLKFSYIYGIQVEKKGKLREYLSENLAREKGKLWFNRKRKMATIWWTLNK
jgi:ubiquinone/menaquinone biosynthesis C-methylase UbiE